MVRQDYRALTALFAAFLFLTSIFVQAPLIGSSTSHAMSNAPLTLRSIMMSPWIATSSRWLRLFVWLHVQAYSFYRIALPHL
jgi:hypothetical protein